MGDTGWEKSAKAYIAIIDKGDPNRELLLDPVMLRLCADVSGLRALDVGCGEGRFCRMLGNRGASIVGIDPTGPLIAEARRWDGSATGYVRAPGESLPFASDVFDLVISYVSLVDIDGYRGAISEMVRVLRAGGHLVVANLGFVSAAPLWVRDDEGKRLYRPMDRYAEERAETLEWSGMKIVNWHRPLSGYMSAFLGAGLLLREFLEPVPEDVSLRSDPEFEDWFRIPLFNVTKWEKRD